MKLGLMLPVKPDIRWVLARQVGVEYAITKAAPELSGQVRPGITPCSSACLQYSFARSTLFGMSPA